MRTLRFTVDAQKISPDPDCDFSGLVSGTAGYLKASFKFSKEWSGMVKVAEFRNSPDQLINQYFVLAEES